MRKSCCGTVCSECKQYKISCAGCTETQGKPAWAADSEENQCPFYLCCIVAKNLSYCTQCSKMPCDKYIVASNLA